MTNLDFKLSSYHFDLPAAQIAQRPVVPRDHSKLLVYRVKSDRVEHAVFHRLPEFLSRETLLVLNNSKVFPCRLLGKKETGGRAELFVLSLMSTQNAYSCLIRTTAKKKIGDHFYFDDLRATIRSCENDGTFLVEFDTPDFPLALAHKGLIPIPPYIRDGISDDQDHEDYQTVFASETGSVAAPTAGLHFTPDVFRALLQKGIATAKVTLHVGAGTFTPVKTDDIRDHRMHRELFTVTPEDQHAIRNATGPVVAVGTTSLRVLESMGNQRSGTTDIFLYPGKEIRSVRGLLTNFHLPESSLLMLVSAMIGRETVLRLYKEAISRDYRFFSYGDAMLILRDE